MVNSSKAKTHIKFLFHKHTRHNQHIKRGEEGKSTANSGTSSLSENNKQQVLYQAYDGHVRPGDRSILLLVLVSASGGWIDDQGRGGDEFHFYQINFLSLRSATTMSSESVMPLVTAQLNYLLTHFPLVIKIENKWSGSKYYPGFLDRFTLVISYCLDVIKWDVIFDSESPFSASDVIFGPDDEKFQQFLAGSLLHKLIKGK